MAGHNQHPQVAQAETLQATETLPALRNLRDPVPGLISDLVNFAHVTQFLENYLEQDLWEQGHLGC